MYDVGDIFTAVGGSLGLFIGFSFLYVIIIFAKFVDEKWSSVNLCRKE